MTLRRLRWAIPRAAMVGLLVHVAAAGFGHLPGLGHAPTLLGFFASTIALAALGGFLASALGVARAPIATKGSNAASVLAVALAGFAIYTLIELLEGHGFGRSLPPLLASFPLAAAVSRIARALRSMLRAAGNAFAAYARGRRADVRARFARFVIGVLRSRAAAVARAHRGRAPPLFA